MRKNTTFITLIMVAVFGLVGCATATGGNAPPSSPVVTTNTGGGQIHLASASSSSYFGKDYINPKLSCVGVQLLDSGRLELQSPNEAARDAFYRIHGGNMAAIVAAVRTLGAEYDGQCTHRNSTGSGNWLPICRLR